MKEKKTKIVYVILAAILAVAMLLTSVACTGNKSSHTSPVKTPVPTAEPTPEPPDPYELMLLEPEDPKWEIGDVKTSYWKNKRDINCVQVLIPVKNTGNRDVFLEDSTFDLKRADGTEVIMAHPIEGSPDTIRPGETAFFYAVAGLEEPETNLTVIPHLNVHMTNEKEIRCKVKETKIITETNDVCVSGTIVNVSGETFSGKIIACANFYDKDNNPVISGYVNISTTLGANDSLWFRIITDYMPEDVVATIDHYDMFAHQEPKIKPLAPEDA